MRQPTNSNILDFAGASAGPDPLRPATVQRPSLPKALRVASRRRRPLLPTGAPGAAGVAAAMAIALWLAMVAAAAALYPEIWAQVVAAAAPQAVWPW